LLYVPIYIEHAALTHLLIQTLTEAQILLTRTNDMVGQERHKGS